MYKLNTVVRNIVTNKKYVVTFVPDQCYYTSSRAAVRTRCYGLLDESKILLIIPATEVESNIYKAVESENL